MSVDERARAAASALLDSTRHELEAFAMLKEVTASQSSSQSTARRGAIAGLVAVAATVALVAGWVVFRPAPDTRPAPPTSSVSPVTTPTAPASGTSVTSTVHAYGAVAPAGWAYRAGTKAWTTDPGAAGVSDSFKAPDSTATIFVTSQVLPAGTHQATWLAGYLPAPNTVAMPACFPSASTWLRNQTTVDGHVAGEWGGESGCSFTEVVFFAGNRVYRVNAQPEAGQISQGVFDQSVLVPFLASMHANP